MPRRLHPSGVPEFLTHYEVPGRCGACGSDKLSVTVWDHYGTAPKEGTPEAETGAGTFISALVICDDCGGSLALDRARLDAHQAA